MAEERSLAAISYAHGPRDNEVIALADRLRREGVDCELDVYEEAPPEGWPRWMERMMMQRTVLVIASESYYKRYHLREEAGRGLGAVFETGILAQRFLEMGGKNEGIIPVLLTSDDVDYIPEFLRDVTRYNLSLSDGYEKLYRRLTGQPKYVKPPIGEVIRLPPAEPTTTAEVVEPDGRYQEEIEEAVDESIGQGGLLIFSHVCHFILIAHPIKYIPDRFSEEEERNVVHSASLNAGYKFPISGPENASNLEDGFHVFTYQLATERMPEYREYYRLRRNGLFVLTRVSPDDIDEKRQYRAVEPYLGFSALVSTVTKMMAFAVALARLYGDDTTASIIVSGLTNHKLVDDLGDGTLMLGDIRAAHQDTVRTDFEGSPATFQRERVDRTAEVIARCLRALNFPQTTKVAEQTVREYIARVR